MAATKLSHSNSKRITVVRKNSTSSKRKLQRSSYESRRHKMDSALSTLEAMCQQEQSTYGVIRDYLADLESNGAVLLDATARAKMVSWCCSLVDFYKFSRETVLIALNYVDRYLSATTQDDNETEDDEEDRLKHFQLLTMTCLYTAVKIHERQSMNPALVSKLSRGAFTPDQVVQMEARVLRVLQYRLNPTTSLSFVRQFFQLLEPTGVLEKQQDEEQVRINGKKKTYSQQVQHWTQYQCELAVHDFTLMTTAKSSSIAYCAFINSLTRLVGDSGDEETPLIRQIANGVSQSIGIVDRHDASILAIQNRLHKIVLEATAQRRTKKAAAAATSSAATTPCTTTAAAVIKEEDEDRTSSPRSISSSAAASSTATLSR